MPLEGAAVERALGAAPAGRCVERSYRRPAIDFLTAAAAEAAGPEIVLWCFDRDLKTICERTGQPYEAEDSTGGH